MKYAIEIINKELEKLNAPLLDNEEEDLIDAVINSRRVSDLKLALHVINNSIEMSKIIRFHS